jgi:hypothetical protein
MALCALPSPRNEPPPPRPLGQERLLATERVPVDCPPTNVSTEPTSLHNCQPILQALQVST